jgi:glycosyltransferase involved in cell wall biosynthesis
LEALALVPDEIRARLRFTHIGGEDGSRESALLAASLRLRTKELGLGANVEWRGRQPSSDALLAGVDCLVVSSQNEAFSIALLEALNAGVPVLAADSGGAKDVIDASRNGWLFRSGEQRDLARALSSLVTGDGLAKIRIRPEDLNPYLSGTIAEKWETIYSQLLSLQ